MEISASHPVYELVIAEGSHRELGLQHGRQAADFISGYLEYLCGLLKLSRDELRSRAMQFHPLFEQTCPHLLDELQGLAEGANLPLADALAAQLRGELGQLSEGGCTSFVIGRKGTESGEILIGQNSDNPPELADYAYVLHLKPEDKPEILIWTFGGMIGYHGLNSNGVAHFANSLGGGPEWKFALAHYPMKRLILEQETIADVLQLMRDVPVCSNGNYVLCDGDGGILDVELTSAGPEIIEDGDEGFIAHANHYLCYAHANAENFKESLPDSFHRQDRMDQMIETKFGSVTVDNVKKFLSDEEDRPVGIFRHAYEGESHEMLDNRGLTVASLIAEPARGKLHVRRGDNADTPFVEYSL